MKDEDKSKEQLIKELEGLRQQLIETKEKDGEHMRIEEVALRESEEKYRTLFETMVQGVIYYDAKGNVISANHAAEIILGLTLEQMKKKKSMNLHRKTILEDGSNFPEDRHPSMIALKTGKEVHDVVMGILKLQKNDVTWININAIPQFRQGEDKPYQVYSIIDDITEHKHSAEALKKSEQEKAIILDSLSELVLFKDTEMRILWANKAAGKSVGMTAEQLIGHYCYEIWQKRNKPCPGCPVIKVYEIGQCQEGEITSPDGRVWFIRGCPVQDEDGHIIGVVEVTLDISERRQAEEQTIRQSAILEAVNKIFRETLACETDEEVAKKCLSVAQELTGSKFGLIGEVNPAGRVDTIALSNPGWDACKMPKSDAVMMINDMEVRGIWGRVLKDEKSLIVNDPATHPDRVGVRKGHPTLTSFLGVPLKHLAKTIGLIGLANKESGYNLADQQAVESLSVALMEALNRKRIEMELTQSHKQFRSLARHLQSVLETERTCIAREIHDELGQTLTALKMDLSWLNKRLSKDQKPLAEKIKSMSKLIYTTIQTMKRISTDLRPGILDDLGIAAAIEWQAEEFQHRIGIKCQVTVEPKEIILDQDLSTAIFRIFQETLTNVARHAKATCVKVSLMEKDGNIELKVSDNGKGITEKQIYDHKSLGLIGMRERISLWGGKIEIGGHKDEGTTITVWVPLEKEGERH